MRISHYQYDFAYCFSVASGCRSSIIATTKGTPARVRFPPCVLRPQKGVKLCTEECIPNLTW